MSLIKRFFQQSQPSQQPTTRAAIGTTQMIENPRLAFIVALAAYFSGLG